MDGDAELAFAVTLWLHPVQMPELQQAPVDLRPLGLGELLDRAFTLYRNHFFLFIGIMALPETIIIFATLTFSLLTRNNFAAMINVPQGAQPDPQQVLANFGSTFGLLMVFYLVYGIIYVAAVCATTFAVSAVYLGKGSTIRDAYRKIRGRIGSVIGFCFLLILILFAVWIAVGIVTGIAAVAAGAALSFISPVLAGLVTVVVVFGAAALVIWVMMRFTLSLPVLLLENRGAVDSLARSGTLTQGHRGRVFLGMVVMFAIAFGINTAIVLPTTIPALLITLKHAFMPAWLVVLQSLSAGIAGTLTGPLLSIALALIYYDVRVRKEAFDLELMLGPTGSAAPVVVGAAITPATPVAPAPPATGETPVVPPAPASDSAPPGP
jgi:hypothetical protein